MSDSQSSDTLPRALQPRSTTFSSRRANAPTLHILTWGDERRPKLILLHGGGANAHWWDHIAPHLAERYCVIALDFRGHGISAYPEELVVGGFNDDLELLLEYIASDEVILIGHSMGCHVAVDHASRHPATRALALIDISRGGTKSARRRSRLALRMRGSYARRQDAIDRFQFMPEAAHASEALRLEIAKNSVRKEDDGRFSFCFDPRWFTLGSRPAPETSKIACPTLILRGSQSTILSEDGAVDFAAELADGRLQVIQNAGHHVHIDQPEATLSALREFLDSLEA